MFELKWTDEAEDTFIKLRDEARQKFNNRKTKKKTKATKQEGLFKQVQKTIKLLCDNSRHPSLETHKYSSLKSPYKKGQPVFEAYAQNKTPSAYRVFWCYGPAERQVTILAITEHP